MSETKCCNTCFATKPVTDFYHDDREDGSRIYRNQCKPCHNRLCRERRVNGLTTSRGKRPQPPIALESPEAFWLTRPMCRSTEWVRHDKRV